MADPTIPPSDSSDAHGTASSSTLARLAIPFLPLALAIGLGHGAATPSPATATTPPPPPSASAPPPQQGAKLQLHFMDVGQGDGAVLISPGGEVVLFDDGVRNHCDRPVSYLQQLGITKIDYHIASHYHDDHIGCASEVFAEFPLQKMALDRGGSYPGATYTAYVNAVGNKRQTATKGMTITLDQGSANPVTINIVALDGNGVKTTNENDLSVVAVVHYGQFDAELGGDLSGFDTNSYQDIESTVTDIGQVEVYKVNHHGSQYSSNDTWLGRLKPMVAVISASPNIGKSDYHHPTEECLERLHKAGIKKTYWTEQGTGAVAEPGLDVIGGNIKIEASTTSFTVTYAGTQVDTYPTWGGTTPATPTTNTTTDTSAPLYAWSKKAKVYHEANCPYVANISPDNLETGNMPPKDKTPHALCLRQQ